MANGRDPFDIEALRIDPADPTLIPRSADKTRKKKWERKFISFPWSWLELLRTGRGATYRVALLLIYEHWRTGGRVIKLTNIMAAEVGVSPDAKIRAVDDLEQAGLVKVDKHPRKSPLITVLISPRMEQSAADLRIRCLFSSVFSLS
jgi:hypothetical protein